MTEAVDNWPRGPIDPDLEPELPFEGGIPTQPRGGPYVLGDLLPEVLSLIEELHRDHPPGRRIRTADVRSDLL